MKRILICGCWLTVGFCVSAGTFPYTDVLTERYHLGETEVGSFSNPTTAVGEKMQDNEHIAVIETTVKGLIAFDDENWDKAVSSIGSSQAALSMKTDGTGCCWMGRVNGSGGGVWLKLIGEQAVAGDWMIRFQIDYSVSPHLVRYFVKKCGEPEYTMLVAEGAGNDDGWLPLAGANEKVGEVRVYGCGTVAGLSGKCGIRPIEARVESSESFGMNYDNLKVSAEVSGQWGVEGLHVVIKDENNVVRSEKSVPVVDGRAIADFSEAEPGHTYSYAITLVGLGQFVETGNKNFVDLFADVDWFCFGDGTFENATGSNIVIADAEFGQGPDEARAGKIIPRTAASDGSLVTTVSRLNVNGVYQWAELPAFTEGQFSVLLARKAGVDVSVLGERAWAYKVGTSAWMPVEVEGVPTANGSYDVKVVFDYAAKKGNCWIKTASEDDSAYRLIVGDFALTDTKVNNAAIIGGGISALNASFKTTAPTEVLPSGNTIVIDKNAEVRLENLTAGTAYAVQGASGKAHLRWKDAKGGDAKWAKVENGQLKAVAGTPANGLESFDSYALGLDPTDELDRPAAVVKPGGLQSASGVTVYVPNVVKTKLPDSGVEVLFQRQKSMDGGTTWMDDGEPAKVGGELTIPFAQGTLYRVNTILK